MLTLIMKPLDFVFFLTPCALREYLRPKTCIKQSNQNVEMDVYVLDAHTPLGIYVSFAGLHQIHLEHPPGTRRNPS